MLHEEASQFSLLGVRLTNIRRPAAIALVEQMWVDRRRDAASVFFANAHTLNLAAADPSYRAALNQADYVFCDGTGIRWAARARGIHIRDNLVGTDFVPAVFEATAGRGYTYFLLGADSRTIALAAQYATRHFPGWEQVGFHHGFLQQDAVNDSAIEQINRCAPDLLLVGMGNPRQERWILENRPRLQVGACFGIGGLFDYWAGNVSRAPRWLRRAGHEWLWRLWQQPRDKARRYLIGNPLFLARVASEQWFSAPASSPLGLPHSKEGERHVQPFAQSAGVDSGGDSRRLRDSVGHLAR